MVAPETAGRWRHTRGARREKKLSTTRRVRKREAPLRAGPNHSRAGGNQMNLLGRVLSSQSMPGGGAAGRRWSRMEVPYPRGISMVLAGSTFVCPPHPPLAHPRAISQRFNTRERLTDLLPANSPPLVTGATAGEGDSPPPELVLRTSIIFLGELQCPAAWPHCALSGPRRLPPPSCFWVVSMP